MTIPTPVVTPTPIHTVTLVPTLTLPDSNNQLNWSGHIWNVEDYFGEPGPNDFSVDNVWIDGKGNLHLKVAYANGS